MVSCLFNYAGCEEKLPRKALPAHISDSLNVHMSLQAVHHQKELNELKTELNELKVTHQKELTEVKSHLWIMPVNVKLDGFAVKQAERKSWSSHPFYTHLRGYKLRLSVECNGTGRGAGSHVSAFFRLMSGEYDDALDWPFRHSITIRLVDQKDGTNHHDYTVGFGDAPDACIKRRVEPVGGDYSGWGAPLFINRSRLSPKYLINDSLSFSIF
jgi:hypothetical protein